MVRKVKSGIVALGIAGALSAASIGAVSAAPAKSFDAAFCFTDGAGLTATVTWSGYRVDAVAGTDNDHVNYLEVVVPVDPAARQGSVTFDIPYDDAMPYVSAEIRNGKKVWASVEVESTGLDWPNLPRC